MVPDDILHKDNNDLMVLWDLSSDIGQAQNPCRHHVDDLLMEFGLMDLLYHFMSALLFLAHEDLFYGEIENIYVGKK